ncbi:MAG: hypothetical protein IKA36_03210 [Clostridia bacterium]|nr:hypothetical protein [Clostridia bacterium]
MMIGSDLRGDIHTYHIYPLVVCVDRYGGSYSGGLFHAWNCYPEQIPSDVFGSDNDSSHFWGHGVEDIHIFYGVGNTVQEAIDNLYKRIPNHLVHIGDNRWVCESQADTNSTTSHKFDEQMDYKLSDFGMEVHNAYAKCLRDPADITEYRGLVTD